MSDIVERLREWRHGNKTMIVSDTIREIEQLRAWQRARLETDDAARAQRDALVKVLETIAAMDPKGLRADDLGRAARIAGEAIHAVVGSPK